MTQQCFPTGWDPVDSAATHSQLAGVLAGFMFVAITILLTQPNHRNLRTVELFGATFMVLAFDSYLFSSLTGGSLQQHCLLVWSIEIVASAMLAVGSVGLIAGVAWLLSGRQRFTSSDGRVSVRLTHIAAHSLGRFAFTMLAAVTVVAILLLGSTWTDYLSVWHAPASPNGILLNLAWAVPTGLVVASIAWIGLRRGPSNEGVEEMSARSVLRISTLLVAYAAASVLFGGLLMTLSTTAPGDFATSNRLLTVWILVVIALVLPCYLMVRIVASSLPRWKTPDLESDIDSAVDDDVAPDARTVVNSALADQQVSDGGRTEPEALGGHNNDHET